ncbi:MAG TPA: VWA domain-containing protein [Vicinamibacterales bacterium]|nr:VWA domain-containing protein [Vicinamibacterales bacterium]
MTRLVHLLAPLLVVAPIFAQSSQTPPQPPVFRSGASLVALNVAVVDRGDQYISGLHPRDFAIYEDGVKQAVRFFESSDVPVDLIVLLDMSASMGDKMDIVHGAAIGFLRTLRRGDRGAIVAFNDRVNVLQPLTGDRASLERAVRGTTARGATALNNALYIALKQFGQRALKAGEVRRQAIAVLSDGEDTCSLVSFDDVLGVARQSGVGIYTIALQSKYEMARAKEEGARPYLSESDYAMNTLARETGALAFFPKEPDQLESVYGSIANELAHQYSIGYVPMNSRFDGRFRRIVVQVVSRQDLRARTRVGYTAAPGAAAAAAGNDGGVRH